MENIFNLSSFHPNKSTTDLSTYGCSGFVKGAFYPKTNRELIGIVKSLSDNNLPFKMVGNGSNLLFSPKSQEIYVVCVKLLPKKCIFSDYSVTFTSSLTLPDLAHRCCQMGLSGLEELAGIPASMGGAIKNNAGAFGRSIFDVLDKIRVLKNGRIKTLTKDAISFARHYTSIKDEIILGGTITLKKSTKCEVMKKQGCYFEKRILSQPQERSCGCVFKNPKNDSAGRLIQLCGLKGISKNDAKISEKHGNFIINQGNATFDDIFHLITLCENCVYDKFGVHLEREVEII